MSRKFFLITLFALATSFYGEVKSQIIDNKSNSRIFVQGFFDRYGDLVMKWDEKKPTPFYTVFSSQKSYFAPAFRNAIMKYIKTHSLTPESVGLYLGRPFNLEEIDSVTRYLSENGRWVGRNRFLVNIYNLRNGQSEEAAKASEPILFVEVTKETGHWEITDFYHPEPHGGASLLEGLKMVSE